MLTGAEIGTAFTALSLVYQAYSKIKSNKERCRRILERCQMIVDRLQDTRHSVDNNEQICQRIRALERTFVRAANAIAKVGQQSWLKSVLKSEENTFLIDDTQHELTNLVTILNLEQTIDFSAWQKEYETARVQDHHTLISVGRRLEQGNVAILTELTRQGASLAQLTAVMKSLSDVPGGNVALTSAIAEDDEELINELLDEGVPRPRAMSAPSSSTSVQQASSSSTKARGISHSFSTRRPSWVRKISIPVLTALVPRISPHNSPSPSPSPPNSSESEVSGNEKPQTPPPAYQAVDEPVVHTENAADDDDVANASTIADFSPETPPLSPLSPWSISNEERSEQEPVPLVKKVRFEINDIDLRNSGLNGTNPYGYFIRRVLVELWTLPKHLSFNRAIPLTHFVPVKDENLVVVKQKAGAISKSLRPMINQGDSKPNVFTHVFMLCPKNKKPFVVQMKKNQRRSQQAVKAYILDSTMQVTVVSVKIEKEKHFFLIPYYPDMSVMQAKACVEEFYDRKLSVKSARVSKSDAKLDDDDTLAMSGVKPYANQLRMTV